MVVEGFPIKCEREREIMTLCERETERVKVVVVVVVLKISRGEHKPLDTKMICEMHQKKITEEWNPGFMYGRSEN